MMILKLERPDLDSEGNVVMEAMDDGNDGDVVDGDEVVDRDDNGDDDAIVDATVENEVEVTQPRLIVDCAIVTPPSK